MPTLPFKLNLKKVSERDQRLLAAIYDYLPDTGMRDSFSRGIREVIRKHLGTECSIALEGIRQESYTNFLALIPSVCVTVVIGLEPLASRAILEIDVPLAMLMVEKLLGGHSETYPEPRALSDTEQGVLEYLLLQVMAKLHRAFGGDERIHFRFDRFAFASQDLRALATTGDGVALLIFRVNIGRQSGFVRLALPDPFVEEAMLREAGVFGLCPSESEWVAQQMNRFGFVESSLWAEAGGCVLSHSEMKQLEEGDVILFDHSSTAMREGKPHGRALLRVGDGLCGGIEADLQCDDDSVQCTIQGVLREE